MVAFFSTQLDFIFFFYGLAFILLGSVCFAIARGNTQGTPWRVLGLFGFLHGTSEWLDLLALIIGDSFAYATFRIAFMTVSFMVLLEFARLEAIRLRLRAPGRWIYAPLLLAVAIGAQLGGLAGANAFARYAFALPGAAATSAVLALHARGASPAEKHWIISAVVGMALYALATGVVVPETSFSPLSLVDYVAFSNLTGVPIQFIRGILACWIAFAIWGVWGQWLILDVASPRYSKFMQKQFVSMLVVMGTILILGWVLTEYLGGIYKQNVQRETAGALDLIAGRLSGETAAVDRMAEALARSRLVRSLLAGGGSGADEAVKSDLNMVAGVSGARTGYILDRSGKTVAAFEADERDDLVTADRSSARYFQQASGGEPASYFSFVTRTKQVNYYTSYPVRGPSGQVAGVVVLTKSLDGFQADLSRYDRPVFLVDPHGVAVMANRPDDLFRTLWPISAALQEQLQREYSALNSSPLLKEEIVDSAWVVIGGTRDYVQRRPLDGTEWSLVTLATPRGVFANRALGIIITLQMAIVAIVYLVGRERSIHDNVQMEKRLQLEELARNLDLRAATDPLTGLFNRRKFNREMAREMLRARRYKVPLSLILFDIDRFKHVNDTFGHQAGDRILINLSRFASAHIREHDVLARWGGEEFVVLTPDCDGDVARALADKLRNAIMMHFAKGAVPVTCSFGVAQLEDSDTPDTFVARADAAMYRAKIGGRDRVESAPAHGAVKNELAAEA